MPGRLSIGPLSEKASSRLQQCLEHNDLFASSEGGEFVLDVDHRGGWLAMATGPDVRGYLVAEDGYEAASSDLLRFGNQLLEPGGELHIEGFHRVEDDHFIVCKAVLRKGEMGVTCEREHVASKIGVGTTVLVREGEPELVLEP